MSTISEVAPERTPSRLLAITIIGGTVFAACMIGILTRPVGFLAAFWPANALLLGLMVRNPRFAVLPAWVAAFAAYMAADLLTGGDRLVSLWLNAANMVGVAVGFLLFRQVAEEDRRLGRPLSVLHLFAICAASSLAASLAGGGAARLLFDRGLWTGIELWFVTELVNFLVVLPTVLTFPAPRIGSVREAAASLTVARALPALALVLSAGIGIVMGGPGAIAFPVPALIWCSLSYGVFSTAVLTMALCAGMLIAISSGILSLPMSTDAIESTSSLRLGVALLALGPLTIASINGARNALMQRLAYAVSHDDLTGILARGAALSRGSALAQAHGSAARPLAMLAMDLDHFKQVNDRYGHAAGDRVLVQFAGTVSLLLRPGDVLGRIGGEEFALFLPDTTSAEALEIAERVRGSVERMAVFVAPGRTVRVSVSVGLAMLNNEDEPRFERLMVRADRALYEAKAAGRNKVAAAG